MSPACITFPGRVSGLSAMPSSQAPQLESPGPGFTNLADSTMFTAGGYNYDLAMGMAIDPRYHAGQPDMFMDSFWPIPEAADWIMNDLDQQL